MSDWQLRAACRGTDDPDVFYPGRGQGNFGAAQHKALRMCGRCPVVPDCAKDVKGMPPEQVHVGMVRAGRYWGTKGGYKPAPERAEKVAAGSGRADVPIRGENALRTSSEGGRGTQDEMGDEG